MPMPSAGALGRLWRYYQAGLVNTLFGYGLYALFLKLGMNMYAAQALSHVLGVVFNYFTYSRHAFQGTQSSKARFILSYVFNYLLGLLALAAAAVIIASPYLAGFAAVIIASIVNFFILNHFVFTRKVAQ